MTRAEMRSVRGGNLPVVMVRVIRILLLLVTCSALPTDANGSCSMINCQKDCRVSSPSFQPQRCDDCCTPISDISNQQEDSWNDRLAVLEEAVKELRVMTGILLGIVLLLLVALVVIIFHIFKFFPKLSLPIFFSNNKKGNIQETAPHKPCNGVDSNSTVVRIANYQNKHSPISKRVSVSQSVKGPTEDTVGSHEFQPPSYRIRHPSESTCPDESNDMPPHVYDNLALSTSTLHNTSNSSTDTLGAAVSTNTLETTLPSGNHLHSTTAGEMTQV